MKNTNKQIRKEEKQARKFATRMAKQFIRSAMAKVRRCKKENKPAVFTPFLNKKEIAIARYILSKKGYALYTIENNKVVITED